MSLTYNPANGLLTRTTLGNVTTSQTYSSYGELASYEAKYGVSTLFSTSYTKDSLGRITILTETVEGTTKVKRYSYDAVGRLEKVGENNVLISQYSYDGNGNRLAHWTPTATDSGTYDAQDRLLNYSNTSYSYTLNGELLFKIEGTDTTRYTYDNFGNLTKVVLPNGDVIEYVIDGRNRRIAKKLNGIIIKKWLYAGQLSPIAELDSANNIISRFVGGYFVKAGVTYRFVTDQLGSIRLVINTSTGTVAQRLDYDEFGNVTYNSNPEFQPFGYAGGLYDTQTKLVRFGFRDYDAITGRWTTKDPIGFEGKDANLYAYVGSDPLNNIDSDGLTKGGKQNIRVGNFNVHSDPNEIQKAIDEAIKLKQSPEHIKKLKALHKVASRIKKFKGLSLRYPFLAGLTDEALDLIAEAVLRAALCGGSFWDKLDEVFREYLNAPPPLYFRELLKDNNELFSEPTEA